MVSVRNTGPEFRIQWKPGKEEADKKTLEAWAREKITTSEAIRQIENRYEMHPGALSSRVFLENAHWLGYWKGCEWRERLEATTDL